MSSIAACTAEVQEQDPPKSPPVRIVGETTEEPDRDEEAIQQRLEELKNAVAANLTNGFTQMPDSVRRDPTLSRSAKIVYEQLLSYMWRKDCCWPSQATIASDLGTTSRRTVIRATQELYERGYIEKYRRGLGRTNVYFVNPLSFVQSFKTPGRGAGRVLTIGSPEQQAHISTTPAPDVTFSYMVMCQNDLSRSDKPAQPEAPECHTKHTKNEDIQEKNRYSNDSTAQKGTGIAATTIRSVYETEQVRSTENTNRNQSNEDKGRAAAEHAKALETARAAQYSNPQAAAISAATGIPAAHLAELGIAQEPARRPIPDFIARVMADFTRELGDSPRSAKSNVTRAAKLYYFALDYIRQAQDDPEGFYLEQLYQARAAAYKVTNIKHHNGNRLNRVPVFFHCLENLFELTDDERAYVRSDLPLQKPEG